jgi:putative hydrolase of the HAD superfamily
MKVDAVVFDWYATLGQPLAGDVWNRLPDLVREAGGQLDEEASRAFWHDHPTDHVEHSSDRDSYEAFQADRMTEMFRQCGVPETAVGPLVDAVATERYGRVFPLYDDVVPTVEALRTRGLRVGVCSNWDWNLADQFDAHGIGGLFDGAVCSAIVGYAKPHPGIFDAVVRDLDVDPATTLFVGDTWEADVGGSSAAGFTPVHIVRRGSCTVDDHGDVACIADLGGLVDLIGPYPEDD